MLWLSCPFIVRGLQGFQPLVTGEAVIRSVVLGLPQCWIFLGQRPTPLVEFQKIFHVPDGLGSAVYSDLYYYLISSLIWEWPSLDSAPESQLPFRLSVLPRFVPYLDIDCFSLYLIVYFYLSAYDTCVQCFYAILRNDTG